MSFVQRRAASVLYDSHLGLQLELYKTGGSYKMRASRVALQLHALSTRVSSTCLHSSLFPHSTNYSTSFYFTFAIYYNSWTMIIFLNESESLVLWFSGNTYISPSLDSNVSFTNIYDNNRRVRTIWTSTPVCMGRRSSKIAGRKVRHSFLVVSG